MSEEMRMWLYPLGFFAAIAFASRFIVQWLQSEWKKKSTVSPLFWRLSFLGNVLLVIHSLIQIQLHVCLAQACNTVISWRNLNLMKTSSSHARFRTVLIILSITLAACISLFILQGYLFNEGSIEWFRIPTSQISEDGLEQPSVIWHIFGTLGILLFSGRFWVQWWSAENHKKSVLSHSFWLQSLMGAFLSLIYFVHINDYVNIIGPALGMIPYIRNIMLLKNEKRQIKPVEN